MEEQISKDSKYNQSKKRLNDNGHIIPDKKLKPTSNDGSFILELNVLNKKQETTEEVDEELDVAQQMLRIQHKELLDERRTTNYDRFHDLDRFMGNVYSAINKQCSNFGNLLDTKRFTQTIVLIYQRKHPNWIPVGESLKNILANRIGLLKQMHTTQLNPTENAFGHEVKRNATTPTGWTQTTELSWKIKQVETDIAFEINRLITTMERSPVLPKEKQLLLSTSAGVPNWRFCINKYHAFWFEQLREELRLQQEDDKNTTLVGQCDTDLSIDGISWILLPEDLVLRYTWDINDTIEIATQDSNNFTRATIKSIQWSDEMDDDCGGCCKLQLQFRHAEQEMKILFHKHRNVELKKPQTTITLQRWLDSVNFILEDGSNRSVGQCIWGGRIPNELRNDEDLKIVKYYLENPSSPQHHLLAKLNDNQQKSLCCALKNEITLLMGPPGTGKTFWIAALLWCYFEFFEMSSGKILVSAPTNVAIDNICWEFIQSYNVSSTQVARACSKDLVLPLELEPFRLSKGNLGDKVKVCFATAVHARGKLLGILDFDVVIMDEASQATEPDIVCAIAGRNVRQLILVGDPFQNQPVARTAELQVSFMERTILQQPSSIQKLTKQYRMLSELANIPRSYVYEQYEDANKQVPRLDLPLFKEHPCWFLHISSLEIKDISRSYYNYACCRSVVDALILLLKTEKIKGEQIGVIDGYRADKQVLGELLKKRRNRMIEEKQKQVRNEQKKQQQNKDKDQQEQNEVKKPSLSIVEELGKIDINTIDGFQGAQKDFIILCTVRANKTHKIGFLENLSRFNVATTRARSGLLIVGDFMTLYQSSADFWKAFLFQLHSNNRVLFSIEQFKNRMNVEPNNCNNVSTV